jgi:hypothetical protein
VQSERTTDPEFADESFDLEPLELDKAPNIEVRPVERTRALLAYLLFGLLAFLLAALIMMLSFHVVTVQGFAEIAGVVVAPIVGLLGAATGYYYGRGDR